MLVKCSRPVARRSVAPSAAGRNGLPVSAWISRAMPITDMQSEPIRRDVEVEDHVAEVVAKFFADRRVCVEDVDPGVVVGDAELVAGAEHPLGLDPAQLAAADLDPLARPCSAAGLPPGMTSGTLAPTKRFGAPVTMVDSASPRSTLAINRLSALGWRSRSTHLSDDDALPLGADLLDRLGLGAGHRQPVGQLLRRQVDLDIVAQPG